MGATLARELDVLTHAPRELSPEEAAAPIAAAAKSGAPLRVLGADAVLRGRVLAHAIAAGQPIFCVVADETTALRLACDAAFFLGLRGPAPLDTDGPIVVLPELDTSPLGDLVPDDLPFRDELDPLLGVGGLTGCRCWPLLRELVALAFMSLTSKLQYDTQDNQGQSGRADAATRGNSNDCVPRCLFTNARSRWRRDGPSLSRPLDSTWS